MPASLLALLTDRRLVPPHWTLAQAVAPAVTGGVDLVLLGEADLPAGPRRSVARFVQQAIRGRCPLYVVADKDLATEIRAEGYAIAEESAAGEPHLRIRPFRAGSGPALEEMLLVAADWADPERAQEELTAAVGSGEPRVIAGWDVPLDRAAECLSLGAAGVCVCSAAMECEDRAAAMRAYVVAMAAHGR